MLTWKRIAGAVVVLAVAIVVAGVAILKSIDFNEYKSLIAERAKAATGRELAIAGNLHLELALNPAVAVEGVTFANASWGSRPEMVRLERMVAEVELLPLLSGDVRVKRLVLEGLDLLAETDKQGRGNWELQAPGAKAPAPATTEDAPARLPRIDSVRVKDLTVTYLNGASGTRTRLRLESLDVHADDASSPVKVALTGDVDGNGFRAQGWVGPIKTLVEGGAPYAFELEAEAMKAEFVLKGSAAEPRALKGLDVTVRAKGRDLAETLAGVEGLVPALKGRNLPAIGPFEARLTAKGSPPALALSGIEAKLGKPERVVLSVSGAIADGLAARGLDLAVAAEGRDVGPLARALGAEAPRLPPFTVKGRLTDPKGGYRVEGLVATLGGSDLAGDVTVRLVGVPRPTVEADLSSKLLDLDALVPRSQVPPPPTGARKDRVFPRDPLPLDGLKAADGRVTVSVNRLVTDGIAVDDVKARVVLGAGRLDVRPLAAKLSGGRVTGDLVVDGSGAGPALAVNLDARDIDYGALLKQLDLTDIAKGRLDAKASLKGEGGSVAAVMAGLDGRFRVSTEGGTVESGLLNVLSADVASALPFVDSKGDKDIRCGVVDFEIRKGQARARALVVETGGLSLIGTGGINLADETINLSFDPRAKKISVLKLTLLPFDVGGTLASPTVAPNVAGTAVGAVTGAVSTAKDLAKGVVEGGVGTIGKIVGLGGNGKGEGEDPAKTRARALDDTDYCKLALAGRPVSRAAPKSLDESGDAATPALGKEPAPVPAQTPVKPADTTTEKIDKKLDTLGRDIGGALKGLFGK